MQRVFSLKFTIFQMAAYDRSGTILQFLKGNNIAPIQTLLEPRIEPGGGHIARSLFVLSFGIKPNKLFPGERLQNGFGKLSKFGDINEF